MISFHTTSFFGCSIDSFSVVSKENKIESVWAGEVQKRLIHLPVRGIQQAVPQWRHGWNLIQPGKRKKITSKSQLRSTCAQLRPFELTAQIIFLLNHTAVCLGYLCLFLLYTVTDLDSWVDPGNLGALLMPPPCWGLAQAPNAKLWYWGPNPLVASHPPLVHPAATAQLGFEDSP